MNRSPNNRISHPLLLALGILTYWLVASYLLDKTEIGCVFLYFLGIPCPGCGMTRAFQAVLRLDLAAAFSFHPLIFAMPYIIAYILFPLKGRIHKYILSIIGIIAIINWVYRILCVTI